MGTCQDFCPAKERRERKQQRRLHVLELGPLKTNQTSESAEDTGRKYMIKEYSRPAAGKDSTRKSDLRPPVVLLQVVEYMISELVIRRDLPWYKIYQFVFDRLRAVRQDLVIQQASCQESVTILEHAVRFHIYAGHRLCEESISNFEPKFNTDHTQECLKRLLVEYRENGVRSENHIEFEALYILSNLGSFEVILNALSLPASIRKHPSMHLALSISNCFLHGNFVRLGRLASKCSYLQSCAIHQYLPVIRCEALSALNAAYSGRNLKFPAELLAKWLLFDSTVDALEFCKQSGLEATIDGIRFQRGSLKLEWKQWPNKRSYQLVERKLPQEFSISAIIRGSASQADYVERSKRMPKR